jgi:putative YphP/YqiW family bacilliredoxin
MYPDEVVRPMREELTCIGFREMRTPQEVDALLANASGTALVVVNSICGCAAGKARPGVVACPQLLHRV